MFSKYQLKAEATCVVPAQRVQKMLMTAPQQKEYGSRHNESWLAAAYRWAHANRSEIFWVGLFGVLWAYFDPPKGERPLHAWLLQQGVVGETVVQAFAKDHLIGLGTIAVAMYTRSLALSTKQLFVATAEGLKESEIARTHLSLAHKWDEMILLRRRLATQLIARRADKSKSIQEGLATQVLNFFEDLGSLLRRGRLDRELTYQGFSQAAFAYWSVYGREFAAHLNRNSGDDTYSSFAYLIGQMEGRRAEEYASLGVILTAVQPLNDYADNQPEQDRFLERERTLFYLSDSDQPSATSSQDSTCQVPPA